LRREQGLPCEAGEFAEGAKNRRRKKIRSYSMILLLLKDIGRSITEKGIFFDGKK